MTNAVFAPLARNPALRSLRFSDVPVGGPGLAALARRPPPTEGDDPTAPVPLLVALLRAEARGEALADPWSLIAQAGPEMAVFGVTDPWLGALTTAALVRRRVSVPPSAALSLSLDDVGLTDETLRALPPLPIESLTLRGDSLTADAIVDFIGAQRHLRRIQAWESPAARDDGPARIAAALAARQAEVAP